MVLNNKTPYSSDDEDSRDLDPWEFIESENQVLQSEAETHRNATAENQGDGPSRTQNSIEETGYDGENASSMQKDGNDDDGEEIIAKKNVGASSPVDVNKESSAIKNENSHSNLHAHDEVKENITQLDISDTSNENSPVQESTPLNAGDDTTTTNGRPDSPEQHLPLPLHQTWNFITSSLQEIDRQNQIRQRTQHGVKKINTSVQNLWTNVTTKTQRLATTLQTQCDQADMQARETSLHIQQSLSSTKDNLCRINSEYRIHEKVAAVAAVGGAILMASGNPRAGASSLLVAGGALAAGEVMSATSERGCSTFTRDYGLREGMHLD
eukprot:CCRYP_007433-RA/>CCRYP_007433-RA protein AED:0.34 eAED:0.34 QI:0/-1/0/1/-1/1/1/0/324